MERLLTRPLVTNLGSFDAGGAPVVSAYLGIDNATDFRGTVLARFKSLVAENQSRLFAGRSGDDETAVREDIEKISAFISNMRKIDIQGLAVFSCSRKGFFETLGVPAPFRPQLIVSLRPAVAPLVAMLEDYKRVAVCIVDRRNAKLYEYFMGRIGEVTAFTDDVPGRVRVAGWAGWQETKIAHHIEKAEMIHLRNAAELLFEQFRLRGFDWLFLGVRPEMRETFTGVLHTYVRERLKGYLDVQMATPSEEVRQKTTQLAAKLKSDGLKALAQRVVETAGAGGPAVTGLQRTLEALNLSAVDTLILRSGASVKGVVCKDCGLLGLKRSDCSLCGDSMQPVENILDAAEEAALAQGARIRHIANGETALDRCEGIGALTRFPVKNGKA